MAKPNAETIKKEIEALKALLPKIRPRSMFGTDNIAQLEAQIAVLENNWDDDEIFNQYDHTGIDEDTLSGALDARQWLNGDGETETLSEDWQVLVRDNPDSTED